MKKAAGFFTALLLTTALEAQTFVDYYGVISQSSDTNILKMAQDVFFTQLSAISSITVDDKRSDTTTTLSALPDFSSSAQNHIIFYAEIEEKRNDSAKSWVCTFKATIPLENRNVFKTEEYASYYKILSSSKSTIEQVLEQLDSSQSPAPVFADDSPAEAVNTDAIAGIWQGEPYTDKIILMRSGKGFVIFKNGASMNVKIAVEGKGDAQEIKIIQDGKPNASFYPALSREIAVQAAASAEPITWSLKLVNGTTLSGTKTTLVEGGNGAVKGSETVQWYKK